MLQRRSLTILYEILTVSKTCTTAQLSEKHKLSARMIRHDLASIDGFLLEQGLPALVRRGGISFPGTEEEKERAIALTEYAFTQGGSHLAENRLHKIIHALLEAKGYITSEEIAQNLDVSKNTIIGDINKLQSFYPYNSANVRVAPRYGLCFVGEETDIRESVVSLLFGRSGITDIFQLIQSGTREFKFAKCLREIAREHDLSLTDNAFIRLLLYLSVAEVRIGMGHFIHLHHPGTISNHWLAVSKKALALVAEGENEESLPSGEYEYLAKLFTSYFPEEVENQAEIQILLLNLVTNVERLLGIELMKEPALLQILDHDLQAFVGRKTPFLPTLEGINNQLMEHYPKVCEAVGASVHFITEYIGRPLSTEELTHLTIPFVEVAQRNRNLTAKAVDVLVVCSAGHATSRLLCYQLSSHFDVNIVDAIAFNELAEHSKKNKVGLIVSTVPLGKIDNNSIVVNPILTSHDISALHFYLPTKIFDHNLFIKLIALIEAHSQIHNRHQLSIDIAKLLNILPTQSSESKPTLHDILPLQNILLDAECDHWSEAVVLAGSLLVKNGFAREAYIDEMLQNVEKNGEYMVVTKGVAMPHAGLSKVNKAGMSLVRLRRPIVFGNPFHDPVDLVFALCTPTKEGHLVALKQFSVLITDDDLLYALRFAKKEKEIVEILEALD